MTAQQNNSQLTAKDLRDMFLAFFESKQHAVIPSASLVPTNDATVLFTTAGMQPLVPFLLGEKHPSGTRLVDVQKCLRTGDLDVVGDNTHHTFFQMLGNWSLGDYFKAESIAWSFEFLTSKDWLNLPLEKLSFTVYEGDSVAPRDDEAAALWQAQGVPMERITYLGADNFWSAGETGPCGPSSEIFYWTGEEVPATFNPDEDERWVEIWNNVFMSYTKHADGSITELAQKNIDTGMGLERTLAVLTGNKSAYETDLFQPIISLIVELSQKSYEDNNREMRVIADHLRASVFLIGDEVQTLPSNTDRGYILRRLIRRAVRMLHTLGVSTNVLAELAKSVVAIYGNSFPELRENESRIIAELDGEEEKFRSTLAKGLVLITKKLHSILYSQLVEKLTVFDLSGLTHLTSDEEIIIQHLIAAKQKPDFNSKVGFYLNEALSKVDSQNRDTHILQLAMRLCITQVSIPAKWVFDMFQSHGMPPELLIEEIESHGFFIDDSNGLLVAFSQLFSEHQDKSRLGSDQKFKGGLADSSLSTVKLHTATHLLNEALRKVISPNIVQKGSNITPQRLRFDFNYDTKLTPEQIRAVEDEVNAKIAAKLPVTSFLTTPEDAKQNGAQSEFGVKYPPKVSVYTIGDYSVEICMGPHVQNTAELGMFKIVKEESSAAGVRRIKAVLE